MSLAWIRYHSWKHNHRRLLIIPRETTYTLPHVQKSCDFVWDIDSLKTICYWDLSIKQLKPLPAENFPSSTLLDKVMSRKQWHIGVHERHLMFKGTFSLGNSDTDCIFINVTVHTWRQKKHIIVIKCKQTLKVPYNWITMY